MDEAMNAFVGRQDIARYNDRFKTEADPVQRDAILKLLAEEEARQI